VRAHPSRFAGPERAPLPFPGRFGRKDRTQTLPRGARPC